MMIIQKEYVLLLCFNVNGKPEKMASYYYQLFSFRSVQKERATPASQKEWTSPSLAVKQTRAAFHGKSRVNSSGAWIPVFAYRRAQNVLCTSKDSITRAPPI